jgi:mitogen-activated protein kinase 1/3/mitogen-activated protein kinase 6
METDLASTMQTPAPLTGEHCQFFTYQILRGMKFVHSAKVIHRDLKPRNLQINRNCDLKICDFGLARVHLTSEDWGCPMTEYVCTRWYRAPEVLCSWTHYTSAIDVWSIGCIFAEMYRRQPLYAGHSTQQQLEHIIKMLGTPAAAEVSNISNEKCKNFIETFSEQDGEDFDKVFSDMPESGRSLLQLILRWDPEARCTCEDALEHAYLENLHCPEDEPVREPLYSNDFEFERREVTTEVLRDEIFRETLYYYPALLEQFDKEAEARGDRHDLTQFRLIGGDQEPSRAGY